jgi:GNAT superfamily N-acetyltransferase
MNTPTVPPGYRITQVDIEDRSPAELEESARFMQVMNQERVPEDPPTPIDVIVQRISARTPNQWRAIFLARDAAGALAGSAFVGYNANEPENAHARWTEIQVAPAHRRKGLGRALLRSAVQACLDQRDDLVFFGQTTDRVPSGEAFAAAVAATAGLPMRLNQLTIADVDRAKVAEWAKIDAPGYRLEWAENEIPPKLVKAYLDAANAMNDMPKGDLKFADQEFTEAQLRDRESWLKKAGIQWWVVLAIHEATGEGAGFSEVNYDPRVGHVVQQGGTGVIAKHRGHDLGLWMKAAMLQRLMHERPAAKYIRTGNANVNQHMLAINTKLGFRHAWQSTLWQLPLAEARTSLGLRETVKTRA